MKRENMQKNYLGKLERLRKLLDSRLSFPEGQNLYSIMSKLAHYHYNKKQYMVLGFEKELYDFLIENSYNPFTVYRWLLLERIPEEVRFQLRQGQISQKKAMSEAFKRRRERLDINGEALKEMGLSLVRGM